MFLLYMPRKRHQGKPSKAIKNYVKRVADHDLETKNVSTWANVAAGAAGTNYNGPLVFLTPIAQGLGIQDRIGNQIRVKRIRITVSSTITAATVQTQLRLLVIRVKQQPTNTGPLVSNILATTGSDMATSSQYASNPCSNGYFDVLKDTVLDMSVQGAPLVHKTFNLSKSVSKSLVHFTGAGVADYGKGGLYLLLISNMASGAGASPYTNIAFQTWYKDG